MTMTMTCRTRIHTLTAMRMNTITAMSTMDTRLRAGRRVWAWPASGSLAASSPARPR
jgi:hypothetical protein